MLGRAGQDTAVKVVQWIYCTYELGAVVTSCWLFAVHSLTLLASQNGALYQASGNGHLQVVEFLVERGAKVDSANKVASSRSP